MEYYLISIDFLVVKLIDHGITGKISSRIKWLKMKENYHPNQEQG